MCEIEKRNKKAIIFQFTTAPLSKKKPKTLTTQFLSKESSSTDKNNRINQIFHLNQDTLFVNSHFSFDKKEVYQNINETLSYLQKKLDQDRTIVIGGDMNGLPDKIKSLFEKFGFVDCWSFLHPKKPGYTFPSKNLNERIDYFWINKIKKEKVKKIEIICSKSFGTVYPSDHFGLCLEIV